MRRVTLLFLLGGIGVGLGYWFWYGPEEKVSEGVVLGVRDNRESVFGAQWLPVESRQQALVSVPSQVIAGVPDLSQAHAAYVVDAASGQKLAGHDEHERRQIASLTKIMTALLVMESGISLSEVVVVDEESLQRDGTLVGCPSSTNCVGQRLVVGERITVDSLLHAMLMNSANDSAVLLAKKVSGGSEQEFVRLMNQRVETLGLTDTHFCTANGLEPDGREEECYSSAYDVAQIVRKALSYPHLWDIMRTGPITIQSVDGRYTHEIYSTNQLRDQYVPLLGAKTGFTPAAGQSLLAAAQVDGHVVVGVLLDDPFRFEDMKSVFGWSFRVFEWK